MIYYVKKSKYKQFVHMKRSVSKMLKLKLWILLYFLIIIFSLKIYLYTFSVFYFDPLFRIFCYGHLCFENVSWLLCSLT